MHVGFEIHNSAHCWALFLKNVPNSFLCEQPALHAREVKLRCHRKLESIVYCVFSIVGEPILS